MGYTGYTREAAIGPNKASTFAEEWPSFVLALGSSISPILITLLLAVPALQFGHLQRLLTAIDRLR
jgi:hypothetical protein